MKITEAIASLEKALSLHGDVEVLVKGEHNEFVKSTAVYCTHVEDIEEYYVQLECESDIEDEDRFGIYEAVTIE